MKIRKHRLFPGTSVTVFVRFGSFSYVFFKTLTAVPGGSFCLVCAGFIVVFISAAKAVTVSVLPQIIDFYIGKGLRPVTVSENIIG